MIPKIFINDINDKNKKIKLYEDKNLWFLCQDNIDTIIKEKSIDFIKNYTDLFELINNIEIKIILEITTGKNLYDLHWYWREGNFPDISEVPNVFKIFYKSDIMIDNINYYRMEINLIKINGVRSSWSGYIGKYISIIFDNKFRIYDVKSQQY